MVFKKKSQSAIDDSKNWYKDKYEYVRQQRDVLAATTLLCLLFSAGAVFTVMWLTPYKSVEPFVIQIDEKSGIVERVDPVTRTEFTSNEAIDRFFVAQYIRARETYIPQVFKYNYNIIRVMSDRFTFNQYQRAVSEANPESAAAILRAEGQRMVKFKNISFIDRDPDKMLVEKVAQARVLLTDISRRFPAPIEYHSIVTITFQYSNLNLNEEERFINPIGFLVTNYTLEREVIK